MPLADATREFQRPFSAALAGGIRHRDELISDLGHRAYHHDGVFGEASAHDLRRAIDRGCILYRRPTELHHDHGRLTMRRVSAPGCRTARPANPSACERAQTPPPRALLRRC